MFPHNPALARLEQISLSYASDRIGGTSWRDEALRWLRPLRSSRAAGADSIDVLGGISLTIQSGERILLLGPNGSGKTSLCRVLAAMFPPDRGRVGIRARVFPAFGAATWAFPELSGLENAEVLARCYGFTPENSRRIAQRAADRAKLATEAHRAARELSRGMSSRLWLSLLLAMREALPAGERALWILDEISGGEDAAFWAEWLFDFDATSAESEDAIIWVTHAPERFHATQLTRAIVLSEGRMAFDGAVEIGILAYRALLTDPAQIERIAEWNLQSPLPRASTPAGMPPLDSSSSSS